MRKGGQGKGAKGGVAVEERSGEAAGGKVIKSVREVHGSTERTGVEDLRFRAQAGPEVVSALLYKFCVVGMQLFI